MKGNSEKRLKRCVFFLLNFPFHSLKKLGILHNNLFLLKNITWCPTQAKTASLLLAARFLFAKQKYQRSKKILLRILRSDKSQTDSMVLLGWVNLCIANDEQLHDQSLIMFNYVLEKKNDVLVSTRTP
jgi:hypothetical protein